MSRHNSNSLSLRDPAKAALLGLIAGDDFGIEFGDDYDFGDDAPSAANMQKAWQEKQATKQREMVLEPNKGSSAKIQRYGFGVSQTLTLGTTVAISANQNPETHIRPQRVTANAPCPGFGRLSSIKVANVGVIVGGEMDLFDFTADGSGQQLDVPTLSPANRVNVAGTYSGFVPAGYTNGAAFVATVTFKGPASMVA